MTLVEQLRQYAEWRRGSTGFALCRKAADRIEALEAERTGTTLAVRECQEEALYQNQRAEQAEAERYRLAAEVKALRALEHDWLAANGPGGWIDDERQALRELVALLDGQTERLHPVSWQVELAAAQRALGLAGKVTMMRRVRGSHP